MDVPTAVGIGLLASFVQSVGLTLQRRSHLQNEKCDVAHRRAPWRRPAWVLGVVVFLGANLSGTLFQIGTLPVVILAPLGAVSLLYNAFLARFMLDDYLSAHMVLGSLLITAGALSIGYFGAVPHAPHSLAEQLDLLTRPTFVAMATLYALVLVTMLMIAHLTEWQLRTAPWRPSLATRGRRRQRFGSKRYMQGPQLATVAEVSENSSGIYSPQARSAHDPSSSGSSPQPLDRSGVGRSPARPAPPEMSAPPRPLKQWHGTLPESGLPKSYGALSSVGAELAAAAAAAAAEAPVPATPSPPDALHMAVHRPTVLALAVIYSSASGTLSGVCLLLAKSGVDLLILSLAGHNQFSSWRSWFLVAVLLVAALLQLWYLHKSLKLADPVLVAPLAFCFYNLASVTLGLVYFDDLAQLPWRSRGMIVLGTAVLLGGVWVISLHRSPAAADTSRDEPDTWGPGWHDASTHEQDLAAEPDEEADLAAPAPEAAALDAAAPDAGGDRAERPRVALLWPRTPRRPSIGAANSMRPAPRTTTPQRASSISLDHALTEHLPAQAAADATSPPSPILWERVWERGLSIGLSPSSPGFHVQPSPRRTPGKTTPLQRADPA